MPLKSLFGHVPKVEARAAALALGVGLVLTVIKFVAYFVTGSAAIFTDAMESIVNIAAGTFALYSLSIAHRPADESHPYGHGKIEFLSAGFEGGMILAAAIVAIVKAIDVLVAGRDDTHLLNNLTLALILMTVALIANGMLGVYLVRSGKKQGSVTLESDGHHLLSDAWTSGATLLALGLVRLTGWWWADPVAAIVVSVYIGWVGVGLLRRAEAGLTDRQDKADQKLLTAILDSHLPSGGEGPTVCSYHKVRHRHAGRYHWIDFHLVVPSGWTIDHGHEVATAIEEELERAIGDGNATAHVEPCISGNCPRCKAATVPYQTGPS